MKVSRASLINNKAFAMHRSASFDASASSFNERERARSVERLADVAITSEPMGSLPRVFIARRAEKASVDVISSVCGRRVSKIEVVDVVSSRGIRQIMAIH